MRYVLAIKSPVYGAQGAALAYQFAEHVVAAGHQISQVFFFQDGVSHGNPAVSPAADEVNLLEQWQAFAAQHGVPLHLCVSAAARRGVTENHVAESFVLAGLGEFSRAVLEADRVMTF